MAELSALRVLGAGYGQGLLFTRPVSPFPADGDVSPIFGDQERRIAARERARRPGHAREASGRRGMGSRWDVGDPEVGEFVDANMVSFAAWDLVIYLNRNPRMCETLPSLAVVLARPEHDLLPAVVRLVDTGALVEDGDEVPGSVCYRLSGDPAVRGVIARFVQLAGKREHRLEFVRRVLAHITAG